MWRESVEVGLKREMHKVCGVGKVAVLHRLFSALTRGEDGGGAMHGVIR